MSTPVTFDTASPRFGLPLLFSGQSQKEVYVNEAHGIVDALLHCAIEDVSDLPPEIPVDGRNWLIGSNPTGEWEGKNGCLACRQAGGWIYIMPKNGLEVFNVKTEQMYFYFDGWRCASQIHEPIGGNIIDVEARFVISQLISALKSLGVVPRV